MVPIKKMQGRALSWLNARGVLLASHTSKVWAKIMRQQVAPPLALAAHSTQLGGMSGKSVKLASHMLQLFVRRSRRKGWSCACRFIDLVAAFYQCLTELALGPLTTSGNVRRS